MKTPQLKVFYCVILSILTYLVFAGETQARIYDCRTGKMANARPRGVS